MDAIALLKEDHAKAKKLMEELAATTERGVKTREEKWNKLLKVEQLTDMPFDDEHWSAKFKVTKEEFSKEQLE